MTDLNAPAVVDRAPPWPPGTVVQRIAYVSDRPADRRVLCELPAALNRRAIAMPTASGEAPEFELLSIPWDSPEDAELSVRLRAWVSGSAAQMTTFQGAQLFWGVGRAAIVAPANRLEPLEATVAELAYYERELLDVERHIGEAWPDLEADAGPAFDFDEKSDQNHHKLAQRYRHLLGLRARLTRVLPCVLTPHVYPPTLASQVSERLRERLRMEHRVEVLQEQLEVFERIYDACGERASEYRVARRGHTLEMIIIVLLAAQTMLVLFEVLTRTTPTTTTVPAATSQPSK